MLVAKNKTKIFVVSLSTISILLIGLFVFLENVYKVRAAINPEINYQGKLADENGTVVDDGNFSMEFKLYTVPEGGSAIWTETLTDSVAVSDGLFSIMLGSTTPLTSVDFNQTLYLGVNIENDGEMTPRKRIGSVPSAFTADKLDGIDSSSFLRSDQPDTMRATDTAAILTVEQDGTGDIVNFKDGANSVFYITDGGDIHFGTNMLFDYQTGNLAIGTTTVATSPLVVDGNTRITGTVTIGQYTLPNTDGSTGQTLKTDAAGNVTWQNDIDTDTNNFVNAFSFSTSTGVLTLGRAGLSSLTSDLDGRYLTDFSEVQTLSDVYALGGNAVQMTAGYGDIRFYNASSAEMFFLDESTGNVGIGTVDPSLFKLQVGGNIGPDVDNQYSLGSADNRWQSLSMGPEAMYIYNNYIDASNYERAYIGYVASPNAQINSILDFDAVDESQFSQEDLAYDATLTPSATSGDIVLTLGSGNWNDDARIKKGVRVVGNSGIAVITEIPSAKSTTTATVVTSFANTNSITSGSWQIYGTMFNSGVAKISATAGAGNGLIASGDWTISTSAQMFTGQERNYNAMTRIDDEHYLAAMNDNNLDRNEVYIYEVGIDPYSISSSAPFIVASSSDFRVNNLARIGDSNSFLLGYTDSNNNSLDLNILDVATDTDMISTSTDSFQTGYDAYLGSINEIDNNDFLLVFSLLSASSTAAAVLVEAEQGVGIATTTDYFIFDNGDTEQQQIAKIDDSHYLITYVNDYLSEMRATVLEVGVAPYNISTTTDLFTYSSTSTGDGVGTQVSLTDLIQVDETHFLSLYPCVYSNNPQGCAVILEVDTTNGYAISTSSNEFIYESGPIGLYLSPIPVLAEIDQNHFLNFYGMIDVIDAFVMTLAQVLEVDLDTWEISTTSELIVNPSYFAYFNNVAKIDNNNFFVNYGRLGYPPMDVFNSAQILTFDGLTFSTGGASENATGTYYTLATTDTNQVNSTVWSLLSGVSVTEALNNQTINYSVSFDGRTTWEMYDSTTTGDEGWRPIVRYDDTWEYNSNTTAGATDITWASSTVNNQEAAISEAMGVAANRMSGAVLNDLNSGEWSASGGWSDIVDTIDVAASFYSNDSALNPNLNQISFNYETGIEQGVLTMATEELGTGEVRDMQFKVGNTSAIYVNGNTGNVGVGTTDPSLFKLQVGGNIGPDVDNQYTLGSASNRFKSLSMGPEALYIYNNYTDASNYERAYLGYLSTGGAQTNNSLDFDSVDESQFIQEDIAYATTLTPSAISGDIVLTLGSGNWNDDVRVKKGTRVIGNSGVAIITEIPSAKSTTTATADTAFANTNAITSGAWQVYGTAFSSGVARLSGASGGGGELVATGDWTITNTQEENYANSHTFHTSAKVDDEHYLDLFSNTDVSDVQAKVYTVDPSTYAIASHTPLVLSDTGTLFWQDLENISGNDFLSVLYANFGSGLRGYLLMLSVSTSTDTVSTSSLPVQFANNGRMNSLVKMGDNDFLLTSTMYDSGFTGNRQGYAVIVNADPNTGTIATGSDYVLFDSGTTTQTNLVKIDDTHYLNFYGQMNGANFYPTAIIIEASTSTDSVSTSSEPFTIANTVMYENGYQNFNEIIRIDANHVLVGYSGSAFQAHSQVLEIDLNTWEISTSSDDFSYYRSGADPSFVKVDRNHFLSLFTATDQATYLEVNANVLEIDLNTWEISTSSQLLIENGRISLYDNLMQIDNNNYFGIYSTTANFATWQTGAAVLSLDGLTFATSSGLGNATGTYYTITTSDTNQVDVSNWREVLDLNLTESLSTQIINYSISFDDRSTWKIYDATSGDSGWRPIVRNNTGTWEYNSNVTAGATDITWATSTVNNQQAAISQAMSVTANQMSGTELDVLTSTEWGASGGWSEAVGTIDAAVSFYSNNSAQNPSVSQITFSYPGGFDEGVLTLATQELGTGVARDMQLMVGDTRALHIAGDSGNIIIDNGLSVSGNATVTANMAIGQSLTVTQNVDIGGYLSLTGAEKYINFGTTTGATGLGFRYDAGNMQFRNLGGSWTDLGQESWLRSNSDIYYDLGKVSVGGLGNSYFEFNDSYNRLDMKSANGFKMESLSNTEPTTLSLIADNSGGFNYISDITDVAIRNGIAYIISNGDSALTIADYSNPETPTLLSEIYDGDGTFNRLGGARKIFLYENYAYIASYNDSSVTIVDISSSTNPTLVKEMYDNDGTFYNIGGASSVYVVNDIAYITAQDDNSINIVDVSDPANPVVLAETADGNNGFDYSGTPRDIEVSNGYAYVTNIYGLQIINVSSSTNPEYVITISSAIGDNYVRNCTHMYNAYSVDIQGDYAYVANFGNPQVGVVSVLDISNPNTAACIEEIWDADGEFNYLSEPNDIEVDSNLAYVASYADNALTVIDVSSSTDLNKVAEFNSGFALIKTVAVSDGIIYTGGLTGILKAMDSEKTSLDVHGDLVLSGNNNYINFGFATGTIGYGFRDNNGVIEYKNADGIWTDFQIWEETGNDTFYIDGNVGIGTTSPNSLLMILAQDGQTALNIASSSGETIFNVDENGHVNIGTDAPSIFALQVDGHIGPSKTGVFDLGSEGFSFPQMNAEDAPVVFDSYVDNRRLGVDVTGLGDFNGDGSDDFALSRYENVYIFLSDLVSTSSVNIDNADVVISSETTGNAFGSQIANAGDYNNDGYNDLIVSAYAEDLGGENRGRVYIFFGSSTPPTSINAANADVIINGTEYNHYEFGEKLANGMDVNGDGFSDVLIGAESDQSAGTFRGRAYLFFGTTTTGTINATDADVIINGSVDSGTLGNSVELIPDVNGDGYNDVLIGAYIVNPNQRGQVYIIFGDPSLSGTINAASSDVVISTTIPNKGLGRIVSSAGDFNNDGYNDFMVSNSDSVSLVHGSPTLSSGNIEDIRDISFIWMLSTSLSYSNNFNNDEYSEIIIGCDRNYFSGSYKGEVNIFYGTSSMASTIYPNDADVTITGTNEGDYFGNSVSSAGDNNGDGADDLIVGAWGFDNGGTDRGRGYYFRSSLYYRNIYAQNFIARDTVYAGGTVIDKDSILFNYSDYGFRDNDGTIEFKDSAGSWTAFSDLSNSGTLNYGATGSLAFYAGSGRAATGTSGLYWDASSTRLGIGTTTPDQALTVDGLFHVTGAGTSTIEDILHVKNRIKVGENSVVISESGIIFTDAATTSIYGDFAIAPSAGSSMSINLSGAGDFMINNDQLYLDTSTGFLSIGTSTNVNSNFKVYGEIVNSGSNLATGGTAAASSQYSYTPDDAFDGDTSEGWLSMPFPPQWISYDFGTSTAHVVNRYRMFGPNNAYVPDDWYLQASNDNSNWVTLDTQIDQKEIIRNQWHAYDFNNPTAYRYYRIYVAQSDGGVYVGINEIEFMYVNNAFEVETASGNAMAIDAYGNINIGEDNFLFDNTTGRLGIGTIDPDQALTVDGLFHVTGAGTSTIDDILQVKSKIKVGVNSVIISENGIIFTDAATTSAYGDFAIAPSANSSMSINLSGAGDFMINNDQLYLDTSTGFLSIGTSTNVNSTFKIYSEIASSTPDFATGGTAAASSQYSYTPDDAFDGNTSEGWLSMPFPPQWISYDFGTSTTHVVNRYRIFGANNYVADDWYLQASNDNSNWVTLDTQIDQKEITRGQWHAYDFNNPTAYRYYRIYVAQSEGGVYVAINEIEFMYVNNAFEVETASGNAMAIDAYGNINIAEDKFLFNNTNGYLGIGTANPDSYLEIFKSDGTSTDVMFQVSTSTGIGFKIMGDGEAFSDQAFNSSGADYAEYYYTTDTDLIPGEAVCIDVTEDNAIERCRHGADGNLMGIVSTKPAIVGNSREEYRNSDNYKVVGMLGQVPAFASAENGEIRPGDSLTSASTTPGYVMRAEAGDPTVGVALEALSAGTGKINVLISRRNKSLTVETIEAQIAERIANMEIEDEVQILISNAVDSLDFDSDIQAIVAEQIAMFDADLTVAFDQVNSTLVNISLATDELSARMATVENKVIDLDSRVAELEGILSFSNSGTSSLQAITITEDGNIKLGPVAVATGTPDVAIVEISTLSSTTESALVVNQLGEGDVVDFQSDGVSIININDDRQVSVVGEMLVDGRVMICSGGACSSRLDEMVDSAMGDLGVEGKVVAGAYESICPEGYVWVNGSSKYGTMPGFCVMDDEAALDFASTSIKWSGLSQGEAQLACQSLGSEFHLITENEWLSIAENVIRNINNDVDGDTEGLQLAIASSSFGYASSSYEYVATSTIVYELSNGNTVKNFAGGLAEWTDLVITKSGLIEPTGIDWMEYYAVTDYKGLNIAPPYYYTSENGIGRIKVGENEAKLRGFVRGANAIYDLDLSFSPIYVSENIGFRCAK